MSWRKLYTYYAICPCREGRIIQDIYSDSRNRNRNEEYIECKTCSEKYELQYLVKGNNTETAKIVYLVRKGECITPPPFMSSNFLEDVANCYTLEELQQFASVLDNATSSTKYLRTQLVKSHKKRYQTVKISEVRKHLREVIENYNSLDMNLEKYNAEIEKRKTIQRIPVAFRP